MSKKTVGERLPGPNKLRVGDLVAIPLARGRWGYARHYRSATLGLLEVCSDSVKALNDVIDAAVFRFVEYCEPTDSPTWVYLGKSKFDSEEEAWGPPTFVRDVINPREVRILDHGQMREATEEEIRGLSEHKLLFPETISDILEEHFRR